VEVPYRVDFLRGRKSNPKSFNTWVGGEALQLWKDYFDDIRGYPKEGEPCAYSYQSKKKPFTKVALQTLHLYTLRKLKVIPRTSSNGRYGFGLHELRDLARSLVEKAKGEGFNEKSVEFWMGHTVDKLHYNKIWEKDADYNLSQYRIAEKYLNIVSHVEAPIDQEAITALVDRRVLEILKTGPRGVREDVERRILNKIIADETVKPSELREMIQDRTLERDQMLKIVLEKANEMKLDPMDPRVMKQLEKEGKFEEKK